MDAMFFGSLFKPRYLYFKLLSWNGIHISNRMIDMSPHRRQSRFYGEQVGHGTRRGRKPLVSNQARPGFSLLGGPSEHDEITADRTAPLSRWRQWAIRRGKETYAKSKWDSPKLPLLAIVSTHLYYTIREGNHRTTFPNAEHKRG